MTVSVVIPAYNAEEFLGETLKSIENQTLPPHEVIVVDDGSRDKTPMIAKKWGAKVITQKNSGPAAARNRGIKEASGEYIAFLDSDDLWAPTRIEKLEEKIKKGEKLTIIANNELEGKREGPFETKLIHKYYDPNKSLFLQLFRGCFLSTSAVAVRKDDLLKLEGMDENLPSAQDYDLWLRLAKSGGTLGFIEDVLSYYILREGSISTKPWRRIKCLCKIIFKHFNEVPFKNFFRKLLVSHAECFLIAINEKKYWDGVKICFHIFPSLVKMVVFQAKKLMKL